MAVVDKLSTALANTYAAKPKLNSSQIDVGQIRQSVGVASVASGDDDGSVYRICRVHSSWRISSIRVNNAAITGGEDYDIGLYEPYVSGQSPNAVDADLFADGLDFSAPRAELEEVLTVPTTGNGIEKAIWQLLGLSADPGLEYDLCLTANTVGSADGQINVLVEFTGLG